MGAFADRVRSGAWTGATGERDPHRRQHRHRRLRPRPGDGVRGAAATSRRRDIACRFVSNVDGADIAEATPGPRPGRDAVHRLVQDVHHAGDADERPTRARDWLVAALGDGRAVADHFVAVSTNAEGVTAFGIDPDEHVRVLGLGGRPVLDRLGDRPVADDRDRSRARSREMLAGFHTIDEHFRTAPFERNLPVLHGPARRLVPQLLRRADPGHPAVQPVPRRGSPPTCSSSTWRSNGKSVDPGRRAGRLRHRSDRVGRRRARTASTRTTSCSTRARR